MKAILNRRSIRQYTLEPVSDQDVTDLLTAAMSAPSAGNEQPWHFIIIKDREILDAIPKFHPYSQMLKQASVAIVVCADMQLEKFKGYWVQDCSAATENLLIAVQAKGLGAVWLGVYPMEDRVQGLRNLLDLPKHVIPLNIIPVGHPSETMPPANRFDPSKIHSEKW